MTRLNCHATNTNHSKPQSCYSKEQNPRRLYFFFLYCWSSVTDFNWVERPHVLWGYKLTNLNQSYRDMYAFFKFEFKSRFSQDPFVRLILSLSFDLCLFFLKLYENKLIIVLSGVVGEKYGSAVKSHLHSAEIQKLKQNIFKQWLNYSDFGHYCHFNPFKPNIEILALVEIDQYNVALLIIFFPIYSLHTPSYTTVKKYKQISLEINTGPIHSVWNCEKKINIMTFH